MPRFPQAQTVIKDLAAKDAQYTLALQAFFDGLLDLPPEKAEFEVGEERARVLYEDIVRAA